MLKKYLKLKKAKFNFKKVQISLSTTHQLIGASALEIYAGKRFAMRAILTVERRALKNDFLNAFHFKQLKYKWELIAIISYLQVFY